MSTKTTSNASSAENAPTDKVQDDNSNPQQGTGIPNNKSNNAAMGEKPSTPPLGDRPTTKIPPTKKDSRKLFVGGLPSNVTEEEFKEFFNQYGTTIDSVVMIDRDTRRSRGFGFVTFEDPAVARHLLNTTDQNGKQVGKVTMRGKVCEVKAAEPRDNSGHGVRRGSRSDRNRSHHKKPVRGPPVMVDGGFMPPNEMPTHIPIDHTAIAPVGAPPNIVGGPAPWPYGMPGVVMEEPAMMVPANFPNFPPGAVVATPMYYPSPVSPVPLGAAGMTVGATGMPPVTAYGSSMHYGPYTAYPPPPPLATPPPGTGGSPPPHTPETYHADFPPIQNGAPQDRKTDATNGTPSKEGEETGQA